MSSDNIGTAFIENSGLLEMADANKIVLIFPNVSILFLMFYKIKIYIPICR